MQKASAEIKSLCNEKMLNSAETHADLSSHTPKARATETHTPGPARSAQPDRRLPRDSDQPPGKAEKRPGGARGHGDLPHPRGPRRDREGHAGAERRWRKVNARPPARSGRVRA